MRRECGNCEYCVDLGPGAHVCVYCPMVGDMESGVMRVRPEDRAEEHDCDVWERRTWKPNRGCAA